MADMYTSFRPVDLITQGAEGLAGGLSSFKQRNDDLKRQEDERLRQEAADNEFVEPGISEPLLRGIAGLGHPKTKESIDLIRSGQSDAQTELRKHKARIGDPSATLSYLDRAAAGSVPDVGPDGVSAPGTVSPSGGPMGPAGAGYAPPPQPGLGARGFAGQPATAAPPPQQSGPTAPPQGQRPMLGSSQPIGRPQDTQNSLFLGSNQGPEIPSTQELPVWQGQQGEGMRPEQLNGYGQPGTVDQMSPEQRMEAQRQASLTPEQRQAEAEQQQHEQFVHQRVRRKDMPYLLKMYEQQKYDLQAQGRIDANAVTQVGQLANNTVKGQTRMDVKQLTEQGLDRRYALHAQAELEGLDDKQQRAFISHWDRMQQTNVQLQGILQRAQTARAALKDKADGRKMALNAKDDALFGKISTAYSNLAAHPELLNSPTTLQILKDTRSLANELRVARGLEPYPPLPQEEE
jgi:hypothetical protein